MDVEEAMCNGTLKETLEQAMISFWEMERWS